jgi:hypothetical protein
VRPAASAGIRVTPGDGGRDVVEAAADRVGAVRADHRARRGGGLADLEDVAAAAAGGAAVAHRQGLGHASGARREVAALRQELAAAVGAAPQAVTVVQRASGVVGDLPQLARRLQRIATTLDVELELLGGEPDPRELARMLPLARARVADLARVARSIRRAAAAGLDAGRADLRQLNADVEQEVAALAGGMESLLELASGSGSAASR